MAMLLATGPSLAFAQTTTRSGGPVETASPLVAATANVSAPGATPAPDATAADTSMPSLAIPTPPGTTPAPVLTPGVAGTNAGDADTSWFWTPFWIVIVCLSGLLIYTFRRGNGDKRPPR